MKEDNGQGDIETIDSDSVSVTAARNLYRQSGRNDYESDIITIIHNNKKRVYLGRAFFVSDGEVRGER